MKSDDLLAASFAGTRLRMELDRVPLWRGDHVPVSQIVDDFAKYVYLPRLQDPSVLLHAVAAGVGLLTWERETFAYADSFDEAAGRYRGLRGGQVLSLPDADAAGVVVKTEVARRQMDVDALQPPPVPPSLGGRGTGDGGVEPDPGPGPGPEPEPPADTRPTRFHGSVSLDATRVGCDASRIADEVITHLAGLVRADVTVTLEITPTSRTAPPNTWCAP